MQLNAHEVIAASQPRVWKALNDPDTLKACIPGCESLEATDAGFKVVMLATVGPVRARFTGTMTLLNVLPMQSYSLVFEGAGGVAGFGKGQADVSLEPVDGGTRLSYSANAKVGGRLAQVGSRLVDGVAARLAAEFFARFKEQLSSEAAVTALHPEPAPVSAQPESGWWRRLLRFLRFAPGSLS